MALDIKTRIFVGLISISALLLFIGTYTDFLFFEYDPVFLSGILAIGVSIVFFVANYATWQKFHLSWSVYADRVIYVLVFLCGVASIFLQTFYEVEPLFYFGLLDIELSYKTIILLGYCIIIIYKLAIGTQRHAIQIF